jgi:hypothetical protein
MIEKIGRQIAVQYDVLHCITPSQPNDSYHGVVLVLHRCSSIRSIDFTTLRDHDVSALYSRSSLTIEEEKADPASRDEWTMSVSQVSECKSRKHDHTVAQVLGYLCITTVSYPISVPLCPTYMGLDVYFDLAYRSHRFDRL